VAGTGLIDRDDRPGERVVVAGADALRLRAHQDGTLLTGREDRVLGEQVAPTREDRDPTPIAPVNDLLLDERPLREDERLVEQLGPREREDDGRRHPTRRGRGRLARPG